MSLRFFLQTIVAEASTNGVRIANGIAINYLVLSMLMLAGCQSNSPPVGLGRFDTRLEDALIEAIRKMDVEGARQIIRQGARLDAHNNYRRSPLNEAIMASDKTLIEILVEARADPAIVDFTGRNALALAAERGNPDAVKLILGVGCDPNLRDDSNVLTPLFYSSIGPGADFQYFQMYGHHEPGFIERNAPYLECMKLLLNAGAETVFGKPNDAHPVPVFRNACNSGNYQAAELLERVEEQRKDARNQTKR